MSNQTPKFRKPPVIETVLGVQFDPLVAMRIVHFGLFWQRVKEEFPEIEERNPLAPEIEEFEKPVLTPKLQWKLSEHVELPRVWFLGSGSNAGQRLIQIQTDRFIQNWRRESLEAQEYPAYEQNRREFENSFRAFADFVDEQQLGNLTPNQCEVTYVNQIIVPKSKTAAETLHDFCPLIRGGPSDDFLPLCPEQSSIKVSYRIEGTRGRLYISALPSEIKKTKAEIIDLRITARGAPESADVDGVMDWLDLGHHWVVNGFKSFTDTTMHKIWEMEES